MVHDLSGARVWVAGHNGMVGSAVCRRLANEPISEILTVGRDSLDMRRQSDVERWVDIHRPDYVIIAAARVGGIEANRTNQASFLYDNLLITANTIEACRQSRVRRVVILGSSCIYPKECKQPIKEEYLLTGPLEPTNEGYATAKIAALELSKMYRLQYGFDVISLMPTNLYGPNDNFDVRTGHVLPSLLRRFDEAKLNGDQTVEVWGSGKPLREFLHVDDAADAIVFALKFIDSDSHLNVGTGLDISISELATAIANTVEFQGEISWNTSMPDGTYRKLLDVSLMKSFGWTSSINLHDGLISTYEWYCQNRHHLRGR